MGRDVRYYTTFPNPTVNPSKHHKTHVIYYSTTVTSEDELIVLTMRFPSERIVKMMETWQERQGEGTDSDD